MKSTIKKFVECILSEKPETAKKHLRQAVDERIKQQIINNKNKGIF